MGSLRRQDIVILLYLHIVEGNWTYEKAAVALRMSPQTVHVGVQTAKIARLYDPGTKQPMRANLLELLVHGVKYVFPIRRGGLTRGIVTSWAASPLVSQFAPSDQPVPVWPSARGAVRGVAIEPLYKTVPEIAMRDPLMSEYLALVDAVREDSAKVRNMAADELQRRLIN